MDALLTSIKELGFHKLTNAEFHAYHSNVNSFFTTATPAALSCTDETAADYTAAINIMQELVNRQSASTLTEAINTADSNRDQCLSGVFGLIDVCAISLFENLRDPGKKLQTLVKPYRSIAENALSAETSEVKGLILVLKDPANAEDVEAIQELGPTIALLKNYNDEVEELMQNRIEATPTKAESDAKRKAVEEIYNVIVQRSNASVVLLPSDAATQFVAEINAEIDRTNTVYNQRIGRQRAEAAKKEAEKKAAEEAAKKEAEAAEKA